MSTRTLQIDNVTLDGVAIDLTSGSLNLTTNRIESRSLDGRTEVIDGTRSWTGNLLVRQPSQVTIDDMADRGTMEVVAGTNDGEVRGEALITQVIMRSGGTDVELTGTGPLAGVQFP